ncbi:unnamed protein product [Rotaria sp. Silwood1]|nr:unnamed protein product [Rotaria sp. Silwood1]CAF1663338.1 unnamed protein product [Rotaria sp. Silwood1]CAF3553283.1 unnamed protein product [Rotaria sp. Silwood1]CAF4941325.1 unnamed protein product [Rotaria sp. Silwood1]
MLIDEQGQIVGNHEQISYMSVHDCNTKYNIYLLYSSQPTNLSINYSIRIDAFDKITLDYWTSWYLSIPFSFLPVNRIATQLFTYDLEEEHKESCSLSCENHSRYETITKITSSLLIHFITTFQDTRHEQTTIVKRISFDQPIIRISVAQSFNLIFIQVPNQDYYLSVIRQRFISLEKIYTQILSKQRCSSLEEILNKTFVSYEYFNRTKYYPLLC